MSYEELEKNKKYIATLENRWSKYHFSASKIKATSERISGLTSFFITYLIIIPSCYDSFDKETKMDLAVSIIAFWPAWFLWFFLYFIFESRIENYLRKGKKFENEVILKEKIDKLKAKNKLINKSIYRKSARSSNKTDQSTSSSVSSSSSKTETNTIQKNEDLNFELIENLSEIFQPNKEDKTISQEKDNIEYEENINYTRKPKEDYLESALIKSEIGLEGELFILNFEKNKLKRKGKIELAEKVKHISVEYGDGYGYDILSFDENGNEKFIEVKTTVQDLNTVFYMSENEYKKAYSTKNYFIYRVFNFDVETKKGKLYIIDTSKDLNKYFNAQPLSYKLIPTRF